MSGMVRDLETQMTQGQLDINQALNLLDLYAKSGQFSKFNNLADSILANTNLPPIFQFRLAQLFHNANQVDKMVQALDLCAERIPPDAPPDVLLDIVRLYAATRNAAKMRGPLTQYLNRRPQDWKAWLDMATLQLSLAQSNDAARAVEQAIRFGGNEALSLVRQNPNLAAVQNRALSRTRNLIGIP